VGAEVAAMIVCDDSAERHELEAPKEAVVNRQTVLGLALVLQQAGRSTADMRNMLPFSI